MDKVDVAIIGAGAAGLAAAGNLLAAGCRVVIFEAASRIGGRIHTSEIGGVDVDVGAHWVGGDPVYSLGKESGLIEDTRAFSNLFYVLDDFTVLSEENSKGLSSRIKEFSDDVASMREFKGNLGDYFSKRFHERSEGTSVDEANLTGFISWVQKFKCMEHGCSDLHDASTATIYRRSPRNKCAVWKTGGYSSLLPLLINGHAGLVKLDCEVLNIDWSNHDKVSLTTSSCGTLDFDHVIVTIPLAVLKDKHNTLFHPPLPEVNVRALKSLDMGVVDKIYLKYSHRWWPENFSGFCFAGLPSDDSLGWEKSILGVFAEKDAPLILCGWLVGSAAIDMENCLDEDVGAAVTRFLRFRLKDYQVPSPESILRSQWYKNPYIQGSYTFYNKSGSDLNAPENLSTPITNCSNKQVVFFAGEATSPGNFSTVHGAVESGWREADRIIGLYANPEPFHTKIVIVGAGLAGLAAAKVLTSHGVKDFKILEAQETPGGRVMTVVENEGIIEVGAQWAHVSNSPMVDFATKCGLISPLKSNERSGVYFYPEGKKIPSSLVEEVDNVTSKILEKCASFYHSENGGKIPNTVGEFMVSEFGNYMNSCIDELGVQETKKALFDWNVRFEVIDNSCNNLSDLSARLWGQFGDPGSEQDHINFTEGFSSVVQSLADLIPSEALILSSPVSSIRWGVPPNSKGSPCEVECSDGRTFFADHVIVTCSLGYLKKNLSLFSPPLPDNYEQAIKNLGFGTINKIFLFYDEVWWKGLQGIQFVWNSPAQLKFLSKEMSWAQDLTGFDTVSTLDNALLGWVGGVGAIESEALTNEQIAQHCTVVLRHFTGLPTIPEPHRIVRSKWNSNKYVCGAYSHLTPSSALSKPSPQDILLQPLICCKNEKEMHPALIFAGEALHKKYYSTANGAYDCGETQARKLLKYLKIGSLDFENGL